MNDIATLAAAQAFANLLTKEHENFHDMYSIYYGQAIKFGNDYYGKHFSSDYINGNVGDIKNIVDQDKTVECEALPFDVYKVVDKSDKKKVLLYFREYNNNGSYNLMFWGPNVYAYIPVNSTY